LIGLYLTADNPLATRAEISAEARQLLANRYAQRSGTKGWENLLVGGAIREEDSPGNFTLRENGDELEFVAYDAQGAEHVLNWTRPVRKQP
jgi:hypothetical protein